MSEKFSKENIIKFGRKFYEEDIFLSKPKNKIELEDKDCREVYRLKKIN